MALSDEVVRVKARIGRAPLSCRTRHLLKRDDISIKL